MCSKTRKMAWRRQHSARRRSLMSGSPVRLAVLNSVCDSLPQRPGCEDGWPEAVEACQHRLFFGVVSGIAGHTT
ncbi:hypothetical protein BDW71DRAFT_176888 [Aspergillus fruticulosus]